MNILDFFPSGLTPDKGQKELLLAYAALPPGMQVVVLNVPVAGGKTPLAHTIGAYEEHINGGGATFIAPTTQLVKQAFSETMGQLGWQMAPYKNAARSVPWETAKKQFSEWPLKMGNYMGYLANRAYSRCLIVDEAHTLRSFLQDFEGMKLWYHLTPWPLSIKTLDEFLMWLVTDTEAGEHKKLRKLLSRDPTSYILERGREEYRGVEQEFLRIVPLTPKNNKPILWPPSKVKRIILLSATFSSEDLSDIGLDKRWTAWLSMASRIAISQRPFIYDPCAHPTYGRQAEIAKLAAGCEALASHHVGERGLIHTTYALSSQLRPLLKDGRFIFHTKENKEAAFSRWQASPDGVLIASGMHEGINLKYDRARWQAIGKIVWPSVACEAVRVKRDARPEWYYWEALKICMQAYGRVCRMPDDYGVTYMLTSEWPRLYKECLARGLVPRWFSEAVIQ